MKKLIVALLLCCVSLLLATTAAAAEGAYVDVWFETRHYRYEGQDFEYCFDENATNQSFNVGNPETEVFLTATFGFNANGRQDLNTYITSIYFTMHNMGNNQSALPTSVVVNKGLANETEISLTGDNTLNQISSSVSVQSFCTISETPYDGWTKVCGIDIVISASSGINSLTFEYPVEPFYTFGDEGTFYGVSPVSIGVEGSDLESIYNELVSLLQESSSISTKVTNGFSSTATALAANSDAIKSSLDSQTQTMTATLDQVKEAVQKMSDGMDEEVASGMEKFYNKLKQEAVDVANDTVASIQEQFNVDISAYSNSMNTLYTAVSTHSTDANMVFPAASVTLMGEEMVFWEEQEIDFNSVFENDSVQLLLLPLRFVIYFGFAYYVFKWIGKLESLITMNKSE